MLPGHQVVRGVHPAAGVIGLCGGDGVVEILVDREGVGAVVLVDHRLVLLGRGTVHVGEQVDVHPGHRRIVTAVAVGLGDGRLVDGAGHRAGREEIKALAGQAARVSNDRIAGKIDESASVGIRVPIEGHIGWRGAHKINAEQGHRR